MTYFYHRYCHFLAASSFFSVKWNRRILSRIPFSVCSCSNQVFSSSIPRLFIRLWSITTNLLSEMQCNFFSGFLALIAVTVEITSVTDLLFFEEILSSVVVHQPTLLG